MRYRIVLDYGNTVEVECREWEIVGGALLLYGATGFPDVALAAGHWHRIESTEAQVFT